MSRRLLVLLVFTAACGGASIDPVRYANQDPVWVVNDRENVVDKPAEREFIRPVYFLDAYFHGRVTRGTEVRPTRRAQNVNALGEVPDSTWFQNRIGFRELTVEQVRRGPNRRRGPMEYKPWTIKSSKVGGKSVGFLIEDAQGTRYLLKFEEIGFPELQSAADVIAQRILWASGYNVPQDYVVELRPEDLVIGEGAEVKGLYGEKRPLTPEFVSRQLAKVHVGRDGTIRALASQFIDGIPIGGWAEEGTRADDPNDLVPHQLRRDLRGLYVFFAWLDQVDMKESNTVDAWVQDPGDPSIHYVEHYLVDFDKGLGVYEHIERVRHVGHSHIADFGDIIRQAATLGLSRRPWESRKAPAIRGVGLWESASFHPGKWKAASPAVLPLHLVDRFDGFWAAKIIARFTPAMLRAAVEEGKYSDPRAVDYVTAVLIERQRKTLRYWFRRTNPVDRFEVAGSRLCFEDVALVHGTESAATTYRARAFDYRGRPTGWRTETGPDATGRACVGDLVPGSGRDGYLIVELTTAREGRSLPPTLVHLARDPVGGDLRVIGVRRL